MSEKSFQTDGVLVRELVVDSDGVGHGRLHQPSRTSILDHNAEVRKNPGVLRKLEAMQLALTIPEVDWHMLRKKYPDLASTDGLTKSLAWKKFINDPESIPYRVR